MNKMIFILNIWLVTTQIQFSQNNYPKNYFSSPVDIKIAIAGTFGELRKITSTQELISKQNKK